MLIARVRVSSFIALEIKKFLILAIWTLVTHLFWVSWNQVFLRSLLLGTTKSLIFNWIAVDDWKCTRILWERNLKNGTVFAFNLIFLVYMWCFRYFRKFWYFSYLWCFRYLWYWYCLGSFFSERALVLCSWRKEEEFGFVADCVGGSSMGMWWDGVILTGAKEDTEDTGGGLNLQV